MAGIVEWEEIVLVWWLRRRPIIGMLGDADTAAHRMRRRDEEDRVVIEWRDLCAM